MWLCPSNRVHRVLETIRTHIYHSTMRGIFRALPLRCKLGKMCVLTVQVSYTVQCSFQKIFWFHPCEDLEVADRTGAQGKASSNNFTKKLQQLWIQTNGLTRKMGRESSQLSQVSMVIHAMLHWQLWPLEVTGSPWDIIYGSYRPWICPGGADREGLTCFSSSYTSSPPLFVT